MDVQRPERLDELEARQGTLNAAEEAELDNLQAAYAAHLASLNEPEPEHDPDGPDDYMPEQIDYGYHPRSLTPHELFAAMRRKHPQWGHEQIAKVCHVPYWLITSDPKPSIFKRPIWRFRAWRWSHE